MSGDDGHPFAPYKSRAASPPAPTELRHTEAETPLTFTKDENTDRDFVWSFWHVNCRATKTESSGSRFKHRNTFRNLYSLLSENGSVHEWREDMGKRFSEDDILGEMQRSPLTNAREISVNIGTDPTKLLRWWRIVYDSDYFQRYQPFGWILVIRLQIISEQQS